MPARLTSCNNQRQDSDPRDESNEQRVLVFHWKINTVEVPPCLRVAPVAKKVTDRSRQHSNDFGSPCRHQLRIGDRARVTPSKRPESNGESNHDKNVSGGRLNRDIAKIGSNDWFCAHTYQHECC